MSAAYAPVFDSTGRLMASVAIVERSECTHCEGAGRLPVGESGSYYRDMSLPAATIFAGISGTVAGLVFNAPLAVVLGIVVTVAGIWQRSRP